jgi:hypothetical protein
MTRLLLCTAMILALTASANTQSSAATLLGARMIAPPLEYDRPYEGHLVVMRGDANVMKALCPKSAFPVTLGCARRYEKKNYCIVYIADDDILKKASFPYEAVHRHEVGHCNGWPTDHKGSRPYSSRDESR